MLRRHKNFSNHPALALACAIVGGLAVCQPGIAQEAADKVTYDDHVKPILAQRCSSCHNGQKREGDLDVTNYTNLMQGGGSGTVIEPQDAAGSFLYSLITHADSPEMPPSGTKIPDPEIQMIAKWIDLGALENKGSKAAKAKPKFDMAMSENPTARPEVIPVPLKIPLEPVINTARPSVLAIATSPWAPLVAVSAPRQILLYHTQSLELLGVLPMEEGVAHSLRFSRNGQLLLAGGGKDGASGKSVLFNVLTGERVTSAGEELEAILAADLSPTHEYIAIGGPSKLVKILLTADGSVVAEIKKHTEWVTALEFSPDGKYLASGDRNGGLQVWEADTGNEVFTLKGHTDAITGISWRADSQVVCSASEDSSVRIWEMTNGAQVKTWNAHGGGVSSVEFLRDGNIVSCGRDKLAKTWNQAGTMIKQFAGLTDVAVTVSYCDETNRVFAGDWSGQLFVWNAADAAHVGNLATNPPNLADRLTVSQAALTAAAAKHAPLAEQVTSTQTALNGIATALEAAKQTQVQIQTKLTENETQLTATKQQLESTQAQHAQWAKELGEKSAAQPLVVELHSKTKAALVALPGDAELTATLATLESKTKQIEGRVTELTGLVAKSDQEKNTTQAQMDELVKTVEATKSEMVAVTAEVTKLEGEFGAMTEKLKTETETAAAAAIEVQTANQQVEKWNGEIAFIAKLNTFKEQLKATEETLTAKQAVVDEAHQKLLESQKLVDEAARQKAEVVDQAEALKQQVMQLRSDK